MADNEKTSPEVADIAAKGLRYPESLTPDQIQSVCASALTQVADRVKPKAQGYAVINSDGVIEIITVCESVRSAKINALVVIAGATVTQDWTNSQIEFEFVRRLEGHRVIGVNITAK